MTGRRVSILASTTAGSAVLALVVAVVAVVPPSTTFVAVAAAGAVVALAVGLLTGFGILVGAAYVLAGVGAAASVLGDDTGPLRAAIAGVVIFASSELSRLSLDARQPCRFDRRVLERIARRVGMAAAGVAVLLVVAAALGGTDLPRLACCVRSTARCAPSRASCPWGPPTAPTGSPTSSPPASASGEGSRATPARPASSDLRTSSCGRS